jgi:hypothetical protein
VRRHPARLLVSLVGASLMLPAAVHAATPITITLQASKTSVFRDEVFTLTAIASTPVEGLQITFDLTEGTLWPPKADQTNPNGVAQVAIDPSQSSLWESATFVASFDGNATYSAATSNEVEVTFNLHPASMTVLVGTPWNDTTVLNTVDPVYIKPRLTADQCIGGFTVMRHLEGGGLSVAGSGNAQNSVGGISGVCGADIRLGQLPVGSYSYRVSYDGAGGINEQLEEDPVNLQVRLIETFTSLSASPSPAEASETTRLTATLSTNPEDKIQYLAGEGSFTFYQGATELGSAELPQGSNSAWIDVSFATTGTKSLHATWSGFSTGDPSTSPTISLTVAPNLAHATGVGVSSTSVYPVTDGYLDSILVKGNLEERASVAITISSLSNGVVVRTLSVPEQDAGAYAVAWNGRTVGGSLVAAGSYRVRQVIRDDLGATLTVDSTVTVSHRKLVWFSGSITKSGRNVDASGRCCGVQFVSSPVYSNGIRIKLAPGTPGRWGALGYEFRMTSAFAYSSIKFSVQGSGTKSPIMGLHDKTLGTWPADAPWVIDYFWPLKLVPEDHGWTGVTGDPSNNRSGRKVRGMVIAADWFSGRYDIAKVKLTYRYAFLQ